MQPQEPQLRRQQTGPRKHQCTYFSLDLTFRHKTQLPDLESPELVGQRGLRRELPEHLGADPCQTAIPGNLPPLEQHHRQGGGPHFLRTGREPGHLRVRPVLEQDRGLHGEDEHVFRTELHDAPLRHQQQPFHPRRM